MHKSATHTDINNSMYDVPAKGNISDLRMKQWRNHAIPPHHTASVWHQQWMLCGVLVKT